MCFMIVNLSPQAVSAQIYFPPRPKYSWYAVKSSGFPSLPIGTPLSNFPSINSSQLPGGPPMFLEYLSKAALTSFGFAGSPDFFGLAGSLESSPAADCGPAGLPPSGCAALGTGSLADCGLGEGGFFRHEQKAKQTSNPSTNAP
jgi:hypothetical protein